MPQVAWNLSVILHDFIIIVKLEDKKSYVGLHVCEFGNLRIVCLLQCYYYTRTRRRMGF